jgi:hypothetical protein
VITDHVREAAFRIHGVAVRLCADSDAFADAAQELVGYFGTDDAEPDPAYRIVLRRVTHLTGLPRRSQHAEVLLDQRATNGESGSGPGWDCTISREGERTLVELASGALELDGRHGRVDGWVVAPELMEDDERESFIYMALTEPLRHRGLYSIHASALERDGVGVLVPAPTASGKTTCLLALLESGWRLVSDDHPLLREDGRGVELLPFPARIDITADTLARFPGLRRDMLHEGARKFGLSLQRLGPGSIGRPCRPALVLFPQVVESRDSSVEVFPRSRALEELMRLSMLVLDREVASRHFQALGRLARDAACYRLHFGSDVHQLSAVVESILDGAA